MVRRRAAGAATDGPAVVLTARGRAAVHALAGALAFALVWALGIGESRDARDEAWKDLRGAAALAAAPCPEPESLELDRPSAEKLAAARAGRFHVFGPEPVRLVPPIDWTKDPLASRRYRQNLHKLRFLEPLLASWRDTGNRDDLARALAIAADWVRANPDPARSRPVEAWSDKVTGDRVPYLTYTLRAASCEGLASASQERRLLQGMALHGQVLADPRRYVPDNHGLFVDLGLTRLVAELPFLAGAERWGGLARDRFVRTLRGRLSEGVWLEHSPAYQLLAIRAVERMHGELGGDAELGDLLAEMREAAGWMVRSDGQIAQFGDSHQEPVPDWAVAEAADQRGMRVFLGGGFAFVRAAGPAGQTSYLAVTDGFHNTTHKHADELSFELVEGSTPLVTDTGLYDKDPGPLHDYAVSNRAHSTLVADGADWPITDPGGAYGSGLVAAGEGEGWYAIEGRGRMLEAQGVRHRRLFLFRPGEGLVIADAVESDSAHEYTRYLQLARDVAIDPNARAGQAIPFEAQGLSGAVDPAPAATPTTVTQARGEASPIQGYTAPGFRNFRPRWTLAFANADASATFATTIRIGDTQVAARRVRHRAGVWEVDLTGPDGAPATLSVTREGTTLALSVASGD